MKETTKCYCGHTITCDCGEEPKQHIIDIMKSDEELGLYEEPKQETLEEAAYNYAVTKTNRTSHLIGFREGAKWQKEQDKNKYSLDDLKEAFAMGRTNATIKDFNTKFKNK